MERFSDQQKKEILVRSMASLRPYLATILGEFEDGTIIHVGSGLVCEIVDPHIITAEHVLSLASDPGSKEHFVGKRYSTELIQHGMSITFSQAMSKFPIDLARFEIDSAIVNEFKQPVLDIDRLPRDQELDPEGLYLLLGLPGTKARTFSTQVSVTVYAALTTLADITQDDFDHRHIGFAYQQYGWIDQDGNPALPEDPHGMSGSAVWSLNIPANYLDWEPGQATVAGIAIDIQNDKKVVVATRVKEVNDFAFPDNSLVEFGLEAGFIIPIQ